MDKFAFLLKNWKPVLGLVIALSVAWSAVLQPILSFFAVVMFGYQGNIPKAELTDLITFLFKIISSIF